ncbi:hypothetical protein J437_LFUL009020 [Ladona fulva]|uniref:Protein hunchback n=1 Tax=Ladona fulva TaxID=123851 RepID=A0A8K0K705_LADFU|nr:hypothetical protein J437_LFUL009020 [Ladona fulva]
MANRPEGEDPIEEGEEIFHHVWYADRCEVKLEINDKEFYLMDKRYKTVQGEMKVEDEEVEHCPQKEGICLVKERSGCSDVKESKKDMVDSDVGSKEEECRNEEDGKECEVEIKREAVEEGVNEGNYMSCHICGEKRKTKDKMKEHIYREHFQDFVDNQRRAEEGEYEVKRHRCTFCHKEFKSNSHLVQHLRTHTGDRPFQCHLCDYSYSTKTNLNRHLLKHTGEKPFKCSYCEFRTSVSWSLKEHVRRHTDEKSFKCNTCEYSCLKNSQLRRHMLKHTGEKPFKCNICEYSCKQRTNLRAHILTHTGEKPFKCNMCEYRAYRKVLLKTHMIKHTGEKPFKCKVCEQGFACTSTLRRHVLKHSG